VTVRTEPAHPATHRSRRRLPSRRRDHTPRHRRRRQGANSETLGGKATRALGWSFASTILSRFGTFAIGIVLARLLGPNTFGTYAVAYVALQAVLTFNELGVSLAIVRWEGDPREIAPTVTTVSLVVSAIIYTGCFLGSPAYASAMGAPAATSVIRVLGVVILFDGFTNTPATLLQRRFRQGQRMIADQANTWLGSAVTIALAWSGYGAMSLAIGRMAGCLVGAILLVAFAPESLRAGFAPAKARSLLRFGLPLAGANLVAFAITSVDQLVVGHLLGTEALGFYVLALNLAGWPINIFSYPVRTVVPAVLSRLQRDRTAMRMTFLSTAGLLCAVAVPICLLIGGSARPLISFVYGNQWLPASQPLIWLALLGAGQIFMLLAYDIFVVLGRSRFLLVAQIIWLGALIPALIAGSHADGIFGAALAEAAVAIVLVLPWYIAELSRVGIRVRALIGHVWLPVLGAALTGSVAMTMARVIANDLIALSLSGVATLAVVGCLVYRMRTVIALLRASSADQGATTSSGSEMATSEPEIRILGNAAEELCATWGAVDAAHGAGFDRCGRLSTAQGVPFPRPAYYDVTGPLPVFRGVLEYPPSHQDPAATSPLYRATAASMNWDPAEETSPAPIVAQQIASGVASNLFTMPDKEENELPRSGHCLDS
jgi:O-antigen/teichoic acid export membrane protein